MARILLNAEDAVVESLDMLDVQEGVSGGGGGAALADVHTDAELLMAAAQVRPAWGKGAHRAAMHSLLA